MADPKKDKDIKDNAGHEVREHVGAPPEPTRPPGLAGAGQPGRPERPPAGLVEVSELAERVTNLEGGFTKLSGKLDTFLDDMRSMAAEAMATAKEHARDLVRDELGRKDDDDDLDERPAAKRPPLHDDEIRLIAEGMSLSEWERVRMRIEMNIDADRWAELGISPTTHVICGENVVKASYDGKTRFALQPGIAYEKAKFGSVKLGNAVENEADILLQRGHVRVPSVRDLRTEAEPTGAPPK